MPSLPGVASGVTVRSSIRKRRAMSPTCSVVTRKPTISRGRSASLAPGGTPSCGTTRAIARNQGAPPERTKADSAVPLSSGTASSSRLIDGDRLGLEQPASPGPPPPQPIGAPRGWTMISHVEGADLRRRADVRRHPFGVPGQDLLVGVGPDRIVEQRRLGPLDEGLDAPGDHAARGGLRHQVLLAGHPPGGGERRGHQQHDRDHRERKLPREHGRHPAGARATCSACSQASLRI